MVKPQTSCQMLVYVYFLTSHLVFVTAVITVHYRMHCKPLQMKPGKLLVTATL